MKKSVKKKKETFISENNKKRLIKDIVDIMKTPLTEHGIFYTHDQNDMFKGYAILIGPEDTPYSYGIYCFNLDFPTNYPYSPPKLTYLTNDGVTRFNPNLYRNGKVCLSILNTWKGEQWTACQTIRSVLLTLITILHNKPLLNEPGINESNKSFLPYNRIIEYMNFKTSIIKIIKKKTGFYGKQNICGESIDEIENFICKSLEKNKLNILKKCEKLLKENPKEKEVYCSMYNMTVDINYETLLMKLNKSFNNTIKMK
jgi:ubiquitin-protein ligase